MDITEQLAGPVGGLIAAGIGFGFLSGYAFAKKNISDHIDRLDSELEEEKRSCDERIKSLKTYYDGEIKRLNDRIHELEAKFSAFIRPPADA